jgi:DNA-binding MarR family transcriptional regulator
MTNKTEGAIQNMPTTDREELLRLAARRSMVFRDVMRHAVQQLRGELAASCVPAEDAVGADQGFRPTISESQFRVLRCLVVDGPLTVSRIAESCRVSVPAISRMLNHLETNGLIKRHVDPANRRVIRVVATDAGRAARDEMIQRFGVALEGVLSPLTDAELADLITAFGHLERLVAEAQPAK